MQLRRIVFSTVIPNELGETLLKELTMKNFDVKSGLIGLLLGVLAMLVIGAGAGGGDSGRYQIASGDSLCCYVLDTRTGEMWQRTGSSGHYIGSPKEWDDASGRK